MRKLLLFSVLYLFLWPSVASATTTIHGYAIAHQGKEVFLYRYSDLITYTEQLLTQTTVGQDGSFEMQTDEPATFLGLLKVEDVNGHLYIEANKNYNVVFPEEELQQTKLYSMVYFVQLEVLDNDQDELNNLITRYKTGNDRYVASNYMEIYNKRARPATDSFLSAQNKKVAHVETPYFKTYARYTSATLKLTSYFSKKRLFEEHLKPSDLDYDNDACMNFFSQFFNHSIKSLFLSKKEQDIKNALSKEGNYQILSDLLSKEPFLQNNQIRELAIMNELYHHQSDLGVSPQYLLALLDTIESTSPFQEHRLIAANMKKRLNYMAPGTKAPSFNLRDFQGKVWSLEDFKGRYVYINFWSSWCTSCYQQLSILSEIRKNYHKDIEFINIVIDSDPETVQKKIAPFDFDMIFLHYADDKKIKEAFDIRAIPSSYIIDPESNFFLAPAPPPGVNLARAIVNIERKIRPGKERKFEWQELPEPPPK